MLQVADYIRTLVPYVPGKPIEETQREFGIKRVVKLASNENPLGPSPKAVAALKRGLKDLHRYPDAGAFHLKQALVKQLGVSAQSISIGNGSNETIDLLIRAYCLPGDAMVTSHGAFIAYKICAQIHGVKTLEAPMTAELRFDLGKMAELVRKNDKVRLVFLPNPNNPTGTYVTRDELRAFLRDVSKVRGGGVLVALDYAYWEYVTAKDLPDPLELMREFKNVVVLRTFSKVYGLAGLRVGYGVADPEVISTLEKIRQPFNMNSLALTAAQAALGDRAFVTRARKSNAQGMKLWTKFFEKRGIPYWASQGNFVLIDTRKGFGKSGPEVFSECLRKGVIFRPVGNYGLMDALRISIGTPEENRIAIRALSEGKL